MEQRPEIERKVKSGKGSGLWRLILFSVISLVVCFTAVYLLTKNHNRKLALQKDQEFNTGYFEGNRYINHDLGWQITFPQGMTFLDHQHLQEWKQFPQVPGFAPDSIGETGLFMALGDAFSVMAFASVEPVDHLTGFQTNDQIITQTQQYLRNSIAARNAYPCEAEVSDVVIDQMAFKRMSLKFLSQGQVQKRQEVFSAVTGNYLLHITLIYYNVPDGEKLIAAILNSAFERENGPN